MQDPQDCTETNVLSYINSLIRQIDSLILSPIIGTVKKEIRSVKIAERDTELHVSKAEHSDCVNLWLGFLTRMVVDTEGLS